MRKSIIERAYSEAELIAYKHRLYNDSIPTAQCIPCLVLDGDVCVTNT
jgi:hypothetical protein